MDGEISTESRAMDSHGVSGPMVYRMVAKALAARNLADLTLIDVGCGQAALHKYVGHACKRYVGVDVVRHRGLKPELEFQTVDMDSGRVDMPDGCADVVCAVEVIEHLENPRALMRELTRLARPGGWVFVTTPNQQSALSLLSLVVKGHYNAFLETDYPAHITALLQKDLLRIAQECKLENIRFEYTGQGRIPGTQKYFPGLLASRFPRTCSDNVLMTAVKPVNRT